MLVLVLTMMKEGYEDYQRFVKDKEANGALYKTLNANGNFIQKESSKLVVGDII